ncbi:hypothetical protein ACLMJK_005622 [Lecanora helva]
MTIKAPVNSPPPNLFPSNPDQQPNNNPSSVISESIENWLQQTSTEHSSPPSVSLKRKRSASILSSPRRTSPAEPSPSESPSSDMNPPSNKSQVPLTPQQSVKSSNSSSKQTPSGVSLRDGTVVKIPKDQTWIRNRLRHYKCYQDEPDVLEKYPAFKKQVLKIINGERISSITPDSAKKFSKMHGLVKHANEGTFLTNILPLIVKQKRTYRKKRTPQAAEVVQATQELQRLQASPDIMQVEDEQDIDWEDEEAEHTRVGSETVQSQPVQPEKTASASETDEFDWVVGDFLDDGVLALNDTDFRRTFLPSKPGMKPVVDKDLVRAMAKYDGMTNPRPDYVYGTILRQYPIPDDVEFSVIIEWLLEVVPLVNFAWFLIEGKSDGGTIEEADNQVCRGGATLVNAFRMLLDEIGELETNITGAKPDDLTFVFSAALSPSVMNVRVHWAEVREGQCPIFHMHVLASVSLHDTAAPGKLRKIIHNILDWGCGEHFEDIKKVWDKIYEFERKRPAAESSTAEEVSVVEEALAQSKSPSEGANKRQRI